LLEDAPINWHRLTIWLCTVLVLAMHGGSAVSAEPVKIILDTDMHTDCDDAGALAVLHALADLGECEILAIMACTRDPWSVPTIDSINTYYGRPDLPIGAIKKQGVLRESKYTRAVAQKCAHDLKSNESAPEALQLYREILAQQPDHSVTLVTVGYLTNVRDLLRAPAEAGQMSGQELVKRKVQRWVCLGGNFIGDPPRDDLKLGNTNFFYDAAAAHEAILEWPKPLIFVGREVASVPSGLAIGEHLARTPPENPVRIAYEAYFNGQLKNRHVADLAAVLYAVRGLRDYWELSPSGSMMIERDATFTWQADPKRHQNYLLKRLENGKSNDRHVESVLNVLLLQAPCDRK
jgi:inosine-uridine nucleoside N-ribohydrolase